MIKQHTDDLENLRDFIFQFIGKQRSYIKQGIVDGEDLLVDIIRLEDKTKKAFRVGMPLEKVEANIKSIRK